MKLFKTTCCQSNLVQFDCHLRSFGLAVEVDPESESPEASLHLVEIGHDGRPMDGAIALTVVVNYRTWQEGEPPQRRPSMLTSLVDELFHDFPTALKSMILTDAKTSHYDEDACLTAFSMSGPDIEGGLLVSYTQVMNYQKIDDNNRSIWFGFRFADGSMEFTVDDLYCPNQKCDCQNVHLAFSEIISGQEEVFRTTDRFFACLSFKNSKKHGYQIDGLRQCSRKKAEQLVTLLFEQEPDLISTCKRRYKKIRQATKRIYEAYRKSKKIPLIPRHVYESEMTSSTFPPPMNSLVNPPFPIDQLPPTSKVGRNSQCPCGSGKKFKACCGKAHQPSA